MVPILINKDMFEPSYSDLKFMVQKCNYFCASLIEGCKKQRLHSESVHM